MGNNIRDNSIGTSKYKNNSVTEEKVSFITVSTVQADGTTLTNGMRIDKQSGKPISAPGNNYSNNVDVSMYKTIAFVGVLGLFTYDKDGKYLTYHNLTPGGHEESRTMSSETASVIFVVYDKDIDRFKANYGKTVSEDEGVSDTCIDPDLIKIQEKSVGEEHLTDELKASFKKSVHKEIANHLPRKKLPKPMLVITYDDNPVSDYELAYPVHQKYNVPGEVCTVTDFITGRMKKFPSFDQKSISIKQLKEMQDNGWEVSVHSASHITLGENSLSSGTPTEIGSKKWYVGNSYRWSHVGALRKPRKVTIGSYFRPEQKEVVTFVDSGTDSDGYNYLISKEPAKFKHTGGGSYVTLTEDELHDEIVKSALELNSLGFDVSSISYPYNANSPLTRKIVRDNLESGRTGNFGHVGQYNDGVESYLNTQSLKSYAEFTRWSKAQIDEMLDETVRTNGLSMIFEHSWTQGFNPEMLDYAIKTAIEKGVEVTTRSEALKHHGNRTEFGDIVGKDSVYDVDKESYVINAMGDEYSNQIKK